MRSDAAWPRRAARGGVLSRAKYLSRYERSLRPCLEPPSALTLVGGDLGDELTGGNGDDVILAGSGNDVMTGSGGRDEMNGGAGNDTLSGSEGNDTIVGGSGADSMLGGLDDDVLEADDDEADTQIHGGAGTDTATVDTNLDPATIAVETVIPR